MLLKQMLTNCFKHFIYSVDYRLFLLSSTSVIVMCLFLLYCSNYEMVKFGNVYGLMHPLTCGLKQKRKQQ